MTPADLGGEIRVTRSDGAIYVLSDAVIQNDSVVGRNSAGTRTAIATQDIAVFERRKIAIWRTAGAAYLTAVIALGALMAIASE